MPNAVEAAADLPLPGTDCCSGGGGRAVVGHDDLEILLALARERAQYRIERVFAVIGGHDDGK